ncbi:MAG: HRDC domain-containing protein [Chloroflexales bacterium]
MRCRHFTLRLTTPYTQADEARLNEFLEGVHVHSVQTTASTPDAWSVLVFYDESALRASQPTHRLVAAPPAQATPPDEPSLTPEQQHVYEQLRAWRSERAAADGKPAYVIAHNAVLMHIARHHMSIHAAEDLAGIKNFGPARAARYGPELLQFLAHLTTEAEPPLFADLPA